ncbi:MAG: diacylglycerol kinase family protein [Bacilli bacterium]|nr:diacylglycerol kinase family protein [Bacilli bacterium]
MNLKTCAVIYNPNSGNTLKPRYIKEYKKILLKYGYDPRIIKTEYGGHAKEIVSHLEHVDLVISMGGDGTFNEIMSGNLERKNRLILAHIPVGTTNDVGIMFGYGKDMKKNLRDLLNGVIKGIDVCLINDQPFVYVAGFGKFLNVAYETPRALKKKYGKVAYLIEGLKDFFRPTKLYKVTYKVNGIEKTGYYSFMLISNANRIAGINNFYRNIKLDDDKFEVLFCNFKRRIDILRTFSVLLTTDISKVSGFEFYSTNYMEVKFENYPKKAWCVDGEKLDRAVLNYKIKNERNVKIMLPKRNVDKIFTK